MSSAVAIVISDLHFNIKNLELASSALRAAISKAEDLNVPLIIAGDLNDTKAIIRAEVANRLISILMSKRCKTYVLVGNHDLINEKGSDHSLNFLRPFAIIVDYNLGLVLKDTQLILIPYLSNTQYLKTDLLSVPKDSILIMHQGFLGAAMGDYIQDKTSIDPELVKNFTVISGHYHRHQTIGTVTYVGNPYTMSYGEANDGPKGFLILNSDGSYTRELLNLRRHIKRTMTIDEIDSFSDVRPEDLLWLTITGTSSELGKINKSKLLDHPNFKLDLIPTDTGRDKRLKEIPKNFSSAQVLDEVIETSNLPQDQKIRLKSLWKDLT
jgi:DNA repair exonuclease SbcCD nuclease subunit